MQRVLHHRQLGLFDTQDQQILSKFLSDRFDAICLDLQLPQSDHDCQHLFAACENIISTLHRQQINIRGKATILLSLYDRCASQIPDVLAKKLYLQFYYHEATQYANIALTVLKQQDDLQRNFFSETEMLELVNCVRYKQTSYRYYSAAIGRLANYYFRLAHNHPAYLINYALYLTDNALTGNIDFAIGLNALLMNRFDVQQLMVLFPHWRMTLNTQSNTILIVNGQRQLSLTNFITTISAHTVIFAATAFKEAFANAVQTKQNNFNLFRGTESASLRMLRLHLINCMQKLPTQGHLLSRDTHTLLSDLAHHESKTVSECAKHILEVCSTQPSTERRLPTCSAHSSTTN